MGNKGPSRQDRNNDAPRQQPDVVHRRDLPQYNLPRLGENPRCGGKYQLTFDVEG